MFGDSPNNTEAAQINHIMRELVCMFHYSQNASSGKRIVKHVDQLSPNKEFLC